MGTIKRENRVIITKKMVCWIWRNRDAIVISAFRRMKKWFFFESCPRRMKNQKKIQCGTRRMKNWFFLNHAQGGWKIKKNFNDEQGGWKIRNFLNDALGWWKMEFFFENALGGWRIKFFLNNALVGLRLGAQSVTL